MHNFDAFAESWFSTIGLGRGASLVFVVKRRKIGIALNCGAPHFELFSPFPFSAKFWWCLKRQRLEICTLGVFSLTCVTPAVLRASLCSRRGEGGVESLPPLSSLPPFRPLSSPPHPSSPTICPLPPSSPPPPNPARDGGGGGGRRA